MTDLEIANRIDYWWDKLNTVHGSSYSQPQVDISDRLTAQAGVCKYRAGVPIITLYDWAIKQQGQKYDEIIAHELAHAHNVLMYRRSVGHGPEWKRAMLWIGLEPKRCHAYDVPTRKILIVGVVKHYLLVPVCLKEWIKIKRSAIV